LIIEAARPCWGFAERCGVSNEAFQVGALFGEMCCFVRKILVAVKAIAPVRRPAWQRAVV
jgi:hypothetical protein